MFGLTDEIFGNDGRVGGFIGNHGNFGWTCKHINANTAIKHTFGLSNKGISWPNKHMHWLNGLRT